MRTLTSSLIIAAIFATSAVSQAHAADVMVGGQSMLPSKDIVDNAVNSADHTTLVAKMAAMIRLEVSVRMTFPLVVIDR